MIGGGIGAAYATLMGVLSVSQGPCGIIGVICIRPDCMFQFIISMIVATIASFIATTLLGGILGKKEMKKETVPNTSTPVVEVKSNIVDMENVEKVLYAPIQGNIITRENIPDETFASGMLGDGVGVEPETGEVVAPCNGEITSLAETLHAIGITGPDGMEVLIHVGIDTVKMKGDGFKPFVKEGEKVKAGQKLLTFDIEKIKKAGYSTTSAVLLTNSSDYPHFKILKTGVTKQNEKIISIEEK